MKVMVIPLGLITASLSLGVAVITLRIRAYNATGELDISNNEFTLGTRVLLTCDVTELPEGSEVVSYRWYHDCTGLPHSSCEMRDRDPYYRVVSDTLLVDVISQDQGGRYYCFVKFSNIPQSGRLTSNIAVAGNPFPFLYTPTTLLPEHSLLTDRQQATGKNGQQWITCRSGGQRTRPTIWIGKNDVVPSSSTANSATIGLGTQRHNGLYLCYLSQSKRQYFSLYLRSSVTLPTPTVSARDNTVWILSSPDGSRVERYIVEFECSVRNVTFVEKYMSVSASGGTGRVATSVSCFGGLGQLYRVKVWAVSGPSISPALVCIPDGQCREEGSTRKIQTIAPSPAVGGHTTTMESSSPIPRHGDRRTPTTTTPVIPSGNTYQYSPPTPSRPHGSSTEHANMQPDGTCTCITSTVVPISIGTAMGLLGIATFTVSVLMLIRAKRERRHSSQPPPPGTDHYEMVDEEIKSAPLGPVVYEEVDKQDTQKDGHTKHYQELDLVKMEGREYASIKI